MEPSRSIRRVSGPDDLRGMAHAMEEATRIKNEAANRRRLLMSGGDAAEGHVDVSGHASARGGSAGDYGARGERPEGELRQHARERDSDVPISRFDWVSSSEDEEVENVHADSDTTRRVPSVKGGRRRWRERVADLKRGWKSRVRHMVKWWKERRW